MPAPPHILDFLGQLERFANRKLVYPEELAGLIESATSGRTSVFEDAVFHAKFVVKAQEVMKRIGPTGEGYDKLSSEFSASVEKATTLLKSLVKESPDDFKHKFIKLFFSLDPDSLSRLMKLFADLSWVKNWQVDGKPMPYSNSQKT